MHLTTLPLTTLALDVLAAVPQPKPQAPPGLENASNLILGWLVWGARVGGVAGVLICALMIIAGRRNRNQMATEGVFSLS